MAELIETKGHVLQVAYNGREALEKYKNNQFDLVFMDVKMPDMNGVEVFKHMREINPDVRVVIMTGYSVEDLLAEAVNKGAIGVLHKPIEINELESVIERLDKDGAILLVDDDQDYVDSLKSMLEQRGQRVLVTSNGKDALEYALNEKIKVMLLDLRLPVDSGLEIIRSFKKNGLYVPIIVITGYKDEEREQIKEIRSLSITDIFSKPIDPEQLFIEVENLN